MRMYRGLRRSETYTSSVLSALYTLLQYTIIMTVPTYIIMFGFYAETMPNRLVTGIYFFFLLRTTFRPQ